MVVRGPTFDQRERLPPCHETAEAPVLMLGHTAIKIVGVLDVIKAV